MDPGYRSPLTDLFRRGDLPRDLRLLGAQGALQAAAVEQLALLMLLLDDRDGEIAETAAATLRVLPEESLRAFLARPEATAEMRGFFAARRVLPAAVAAPDGADPLLPAAEGTEEAAVAASEDATPALLSGLSITAKIKLASKGTREQRAQLIRDPNRIVAAAVLSSPKLTDAEVESFAKMANVAEEVLRIIGTNRSWLKHYGVTAGLVKNPKTPPALAMQLLPRVTERDLKLLSFDRNVPEAVRLAARKYIAKGLR